ncbi:MAG: DUF1569 domain-containing protein [Ignavibacteria bacterium]|nr:DUF1569 domain-containing protein [Ignavibacteria bacterium]
MSAQHMVEHLLMTIKVSSGKDKVECFNPPEKIPTLKRFLLSGRPLPKNFTNPIIGEGLLPLQFDSLKSAIENLAQEIKDYYNFFEINPDALLVNPTFGPLNKYEWEVFHNKHFAHHLEQFGIKLI